MTPDTPDSIVSHGITNEMQPQRAVISYTSYTDQSDRESQRESSQSPIPPFPIGGTHLIGVSSFTSSVTIFIPWPVLALTQNRILQTVLGRQLVRVLRLAGLKVMRHFVGYMSSMVGEESREKIREVELTLCALLLLVAGLLIFLLQQPSNSYTSSSLGLF